MDAQVVADQAEETAFNAWRRSQARFDLMVWHLNRAEVRQLHDPHLEHRVAASQQIVHIRARLTDFER